MKLRKIISIILVLLGLGLFLLAMYAKEEVSAVKKSIQHKSTLVPDNPINKEIRQELDKKISSYDMPILWGMIGGLAFVVIGVGTLVYGKKR